jgi:hypothetical protein
MYFSMAFSPANMHCPRVNMECTSEKFLFVRRMAFVARVVQRVETKQSCNGVRDTRILNTGLEICSSGYGRVVLFSRTGETVKADRYGGIQAVYRGELSSGLSSAL